MSSSLFTISRPSLFSSSRSSLFFHSKPRYAPPKAPRNSFFPWFNFSLIRSGAYLEPNRIAFKCPVHLTKAEIVQYFRNIYGVKVIKVNTYIRIPKIKRNYYGDYIKEGPIFKKAILTCEENSLENQIPDSVKMFVNSRKPCMNPAILKYDTMVNAHNRKTWNRITTRPGINRSSDWLPRHAMAYAEPIPTLLRGDDSPPPLPTDTRLPPQSHLPHLHNFNRDTNPSSLTGLALPDNLPVQNFPRVNLSMLRKESRENLLGLGKLQDKVDMPAELMS